MAEGYDLSNYWWGNSYGFISLSEPRGGIIKIDYEFILTFKKLGKAPSVSKEAKEKSKLTNEEWNKYFNGHWDFPGEKQHGHIAMFPLELPRRLIKMFSFYGDTVLDPFLGSGTTSKAALDLGRNSIGYEINKEFLNTIKSKIGINQEPVLYKENFDYEIIFQNNVNKTKENNSVSSNDNNHLERLVDPKKFKFGTVIDINGKQKREDTYKIISISASNEIVLDSEQKIKLLGVLPVDEEDYKNKAIFFLNKLILVNKVFVKYDRQKFDNAKNLLAYVYLQNKTFLNAKLIKNGLAICDRESDFQFKDRFMKYEEEARQLKVGVWGKR